MKNASLITLGKSLSFISKSLNLGHGSTWPGHMALKANPRFIEDILKRSQTKIILIAGTNGKTTTTRMLRTVLETNNHEIIHNESGANLLNGIASTLLLTSRKGQLSVDYAIFEVDENVLPLALSKMSPDYLIILNLFRDQLDRYGEVNSIAKKWEEALSHLSSKTTLLLNADDPRVAYLGEETKAHVIYYSAEVTNKNFSKEQSSDSDYCPKCGKKLFYHSRSYSHIGNWECRNCGLKRPKAEQVKVPYFPLSGAYNEYNTTAVASLAQLLQISDAALTSGLKKVTPAFGRQEIIEVGDKKAQLFLSKNPTGLNESLRTVTELQARHVLLALNDNTADGHDVSWIWDVDFESSLSSFTSITLTGNRPYELGLRLKYTEGQQPKFSVHEDLDEAVMTALDNTPKDETLFILPTYTAMLEIRKLLKGRSIL